MQAMLCKEILEKLPKPSDLIDNMVRGLRRDDLNITIDMSTYGRRVPIIAEDVCFGCAATRSLYNMFDHVAAASDIHCRQTRAELFSLEEDDLRYFEDLVDSLRHGLNPRSLLGQAYGIDWRELPEPDHYMHQLRNNFNDSHLEGYEKYAEQLRKDGN